MEEMGNEVSTGREDELKITVWIPEEYYKIIREATEEFEKENGMKVELIAFTEEMNITVRMREAVEAEEVPNIVLMKDSEIVELSERAAGLFIKYRESELEGYQAFKLGELAGTGENICGVPFDSGAAAYYYRKDIADESGVTMRDEMTWEEFIEAGERIREAEAEIRGNDVNMLPPLTANDVEILMRSRGVCFYEGSDVTAEGSYEVIALCEELAKRETLCTQKLTSSEIDERYRKGRILGMLGGPYMVQQIERGREEQEEGQEWGVIKLPKSAELAYEVNMGGRSWLAAEKSDERINAYEKMYIRQVYEGSIHEIIETKKVVPTDEKTIEWCEDLEGEASFGNRNVIRFLAEIGNEIPVVLGGPRSRGLAEMLKDVINEMTDGNENGADAAYEEFEVKMQNNEDIRGGGGTGGDPGPKYYRAWLEVKKPPDKRVYAEGEYFDRGGMEIVFTVTSEGERRNETIENYKIDKKKPLKRTDDTVIIRYTNNSEEYAATVQIMVKTDAAKIKNKGTNNYGDTPEVNLVTGNAFYMSGDLSIGANRNTITIYHSYNSDGIRYNVKRKTGMGQGWKLNIELDYSQENRHKNRKEVDKK